ncbi:MAG: hypothetical protein GIW94_05400 [Candidatus Eremiobacteraeota bacterium]|nr:hypothetical protein [Candidatus Eremiobacteraeota bacterium]MBC5823959.1 hypothetical protein [Candidatus Eremiobacteraeota bacterium]
MPARRAWDSPIAIACLRLFTLLPERPLRAVPLLYSRISLRTLSDAPRPSLRRPLLLFLRAEALRPEVDFFRVDCDFLRLDDDFLRDDEAFLRVVELLRAADDFLRPGDDFLRVAEVFFLVVERAAIDHALLYVLLTRSDKRKPTR